MSILAGALTAEDVTDVPDDADGLRSAARRFAEAADGMLDAATNGSRAWSGLPTVFTSDALQPALTPLMDPAVEKAQQVRTAADEFTQVASRAANSVADLKHDHDVLVQQIEQFHASAPGQVAAEASKEAEKGDILGAIGTVVTNWQQVPELVGQELALRRQVQVHNDTVTTTLASIASELDGITPSTVNAHPVHLASTASSKDASDDDGNWFQDAWNTAKAAVGIGGAVLGAEAEAAWPYVQDAAGVAGNIFASMGNAMVNHPDEVIELLSGLALLAGGAAVEGGGVALDLTGIGAAAGVPLNLAGAAVMAAGAGLAASGGIPLGVHAMTDDRLTPNRTDHVDAWKKEQNEKHPGRSKDGTYRSEGNEEAHADVKAKERQGVEEVAEDAGLPYRTDQVKARVDGAPNGRFFDGLMEKPDGTWAGIEVKSGGATRNAEQRSFDGLVSYDNPAYATIDGKLVKITSVILKKVP